MVQFFLAMISTHSKTKFLMYFYPYRISELEIRPHKDFFHSRERYTIGVDTQAFAMVFQIV